MEGEDGIMDGKVYCIIGNTLHNREYEGYLGPFEFVNFKVI